MNIDEYIATRRSHFLKEFTGNALPNQIIEKALQNAHWAPSHKLTLPWHFTVFNKEALPALAALMETLYLKGKSEEHIDVSRIQKIQSFPQKLSHAVSIGLKRNLIVPEWEEIAAVGAAVQNIYLTLVNEPHAAGYWTTGNGTGSQEMKDFTGLTASDLHLGFFFFGHVEVKRLIAQRPPLTIHYHH